ncbi:MAG: tetratricopeptide repeat protein [Chitinophagaceae bacterium]|nr:MAG: tetratricopeptide repeat protein [Chitinophagaceae bacterium]
MFKTPLASVSFFLLMACFTTQAAYAQPTWTLDPLGSEKKPAEHEEKRLASEKTGEKKFTKFRRLLQNTTTHYNFYFNANNKLNAVVERAKMAHKDDYTKLLPFYPYSIENTSSQQVELDSVIYKATAGLLLHDLRSDWVDNMYLLIGKSYYYRNELDSAALTFQFINYNLFPRKKSEDDNRVVGTNDAPGTGALSIANKENPNILQKVFSQPPSRNDALIWLARTFTAQNEFGDAAGLINILQQDKNLPARLKNDLEEVTAYWFFVQNNYDSAATHLELALNNADNKQDKSRWEFLLAQLYENSGQFDKASAYYQKASLHTTDLIMDIHARLNLAKMMRDDRDPKQLEYSINNLLRMAKKDRFENYRDYIYYSTAQLALQRPDTAGSMRFLNSAVRYNNDNSNLRNKSFYQLGELAYSTGDFRNAYSYYDSLQLGEADDFVKLDDLNSRKAALGNLVVHIDAVNREDSLQRIAALSPADRDAFIKKLVRKLRKEQGLKEDDRADIGMPITFANDKQEQVDLFQSNAKGEWYFYNSNLRSKGLADFLRKWGKRTNTDNWRRQAASGSIAGNGPGLDPTVLTPAQDSANSIAALNYDALMAGLPLSAEKMDSSNALIARNLLGQAQVFQNELQEYAMAVNKYEEFVSRFSPHESLPDAYLGLYMSYSKLNNQSKAAYYKNLLTSNYAGSMPAIMLQNPSLLQPNAKNPEVTARYESIYNLFIEGKFSEAVQLKKAADSVHGTNYWTPQLLYIEAMQLIKERQDSAAIAVLQNLQSMYAGSPLSEKAARLADVLGRRSQIEDYLTNLQVTRTEETNIIVTDEAPLVKTVTAAPVTVAPVKVEPVIKTLAVRDTSAIKPVAQNASFKIQPELKHYVVMLLDKVDGVYINEAKNAFTRFNKESHLTTGITVARDTVDAQRVLLLFSSFEDAETALKYFDKVKRAAPREVSWLPANKYSFFIISEGNLQLLKTNKDLDGYRQLLNSSFGNRF